jgi:hypothetical protein
MQPRRKRKGLASPDWFAVIIELPHAIDQPHDLHLLKRERG